MPEHDLLLQLNNDIKEVCRAVGRIEEKVDGAVNANKAQCRDFACLDDRVDKLENRQWYNTGFAGGIAFVISLILGWLSR